jgi:cell filamentation protein
MRDKYGVDIDPNCYPDTATLINLLNIQTDSELEEAELELTSFRLEQFTPSFSNLTFEYLKQIHYFLFQDIYSWAGQVRSVDISKGDTRFCTTSYIKREAEKQFTKLSRLDNLKGLGKDKFVEYLADFFCEMNIVHPFREGNGRALRLFCEVLAMQAGYELSWQGISKDAWLEANIYGFNENTKLLLVIFDRCSVPIE